jgi:hypothetical protein
MIKVTKACGKEMLGNMASMEGMREIVQSSLY